MTAGWTLATIAFLGMFASITPALISGAVADRMKFSAWAIFVPIWSLLVYVPIFKWIYGGWLGQRGSIDFAGGTAIHVNAGIAALAAVLVLGKRRGWPEEGHPPHSMPLVMIGTGILWFGWFGFNAGSALAANGQAAAGVHEHLPRRGGRRASRGASSNVCVTVTSPTSVRRRASLPASWPSRPPRASCRDGAACHRCDRRRDLLLRGEAEVQGRLRRFARRGGRALRRRSRGLAAHRLLRQPRLLRRGSWDEGLFYGGGLKLLGEQALANGAAIVWSFILTFVILKAMDAAMGIRVSEETERAGLDLREHAEVAYHEGQGSLTV